MRIHKQFFKSIALTTLLSTGFAAHGIAQDTTSIVGPEITAPVIVTTTPAGGEMHVGLGSVIEITFSSDMNEKSINGTTLLLHATYADTMYEDRSDVILNDQIRDRSVIKDSKNSWQSAAGVINGTISYSNRIAVFSPDSELKEGTLYTFTVTNDVKDVDNIPLENTQNWSFTTTGASDSAIFDNQNNRYAMGGPGNSPMYAISTNRIKIIDLGKAGNFVILAKKDVNNESSSRITGHIGEGSVAKNSKTEADILNSARHATTGKNLEFRSSKRDTVSADVTEAIKDMMAAYADAAMLNGDDLTRHKNERFNSVALTAGVHEWSDSLHIVSDVTLSGGEDDVWLFKVRENLSVDENIVFTLANGARAENIFWYVEGEVTIGKNAHFEGVILSMNEITLEKGAMLNGRMYSQASISLDDNTVTEPGNMTGHTSSTNR